jgi:hypothetical protein
MEYTFKHRDVEQLIVSPGAKTQNLLGRTDLRADLFKNAVKWSAGYELGNGQEPKTENKFVKSRKVKEIISGWTMEMD